MGSPLSSAEAGVVSHARPYGHGYSHSLASVPAASGLPIYAHARAASVDVKSPNITNLPPWTAYVHSPDGYGWCAVPPPQHFHAPLYPAPVDPRLLAKGSSPQWQPPWASGYAHPPPQSSPWMEAKHGTSPPWGRHSVLDIHTDDEFNGCVQR